MMKKLFVFVWLMGAFLVSPALKANLQPVTRINCPLTFEMTLATGDSHWPSIQVSNGWTISKAQVVGDKIQCLYSIPTTSSGQANGYTMGQSAPSGMTCTAINLNGPFAPGEFPSYFECHE